MVIVKLIGGLGNQLFQYAIARKIALKFKTDVVFDITSFEENKLRKYSLSQFNFVNRIATINELILYGIKQESSIVKKSYYKIARELFQPVVINEKQFNFDSDVFKNAKKNTYLDGYWQTEKYFSDIRQVLLTDLIIKNPLENKNLEFATRINDVNSVSLHIRRTDYISNTKTLNYHGVCELNYYAKAIDLISNEVKNPVLFVFSDDMPWVKENFKSSFETIFVDVNNEETSYEDLRLMSLCRHNIIANSSFSWWGAWLNTNESKIAIAPNKWFANMERNYSDVLPVTWIKI